MSELGQNSEVANHNSDVRLAPESGSRETPVALPLCAIFGSSGSYVKLPLRAQSRRGYQSPINYERSARERLESVSP